MIVTEHRVVRAGSEVARAKAAVVLIHGRGATAEGMLGLAKDFAVPGIAYAAPQAPAMSWYPQSFLAPLERNEPALSAALATVDDVVADLVANGVARDRIVLLGFSQGACLALEYGARHAQRWGGVAALSGGLIGPDGTLRDYAGDLDGTPVFLGCSDIDSHIPLNRVHESADVLSRLGGSVTKRIYPGMGHTIVSDEVENVQAMLRALAPAA